MRTLSDLQKAAGVSRDRLRYILKHHPLPDGFLVQVGKKGGARRVVAKHFDAAVKHVSMAANVTKSLLAAPKTPHKAKKASPRSPEPASVAELVEQEPEPRPGVELQEAEKEMLDFARSRSLQEFYKYRTTKLQYERAAGLVISKSEARRALAGVIELLKTRIMQVPEQHGAALADATDVFEVTQILDEALRGALDSVRQEVSGAAR